MSTVKDLVETTIKDHRVVIFSKSYCPYCKRAKELFKSDYKAEDPKVYELDEEENGEEIQQYLLEKTKQRTVPNVFVKEQHIGGCDDTLAAHKKGELTKLLSDTPAAA